MMKTGQQNIDQIGQFLVGVEFKGTMCGHLRSAELKCEPVGYCQVITKLLPSTNQQFRIVMIISHDMYVFYLSCGRISAYSGVHGTSEELITPESLTRRYGSLTSYCIIRMYPR